LSFFVPVIKTYGGRLNLLFFVMLYISGVGFYTGPKGKVPAYTVQANHWIAAVHLDMLVLKHVLFLQM
jgi:hypothetical protein